MFHAITLLVYILMVLGLNLSREKDYTEGFPQFLQMNSAIVPQITLDPIPPMTNK
jgi:hypothetical protein